MNTLGWYLLSPKALTSTRVVLQVSYEPREMPNELPKILLFYLTSWCPAYGLLAGYDVWKSRSLVSVLNLQQLNSFSFLYLYLDLYCSGGDLEQLGHN